MLEYQNIKILLQNTMFQFSLKKFLWLKKSKILCRRHSLLLILMEKKLLECFPKNICKKINQKEFRVEKVIKKKGDKLYLHWKGYDSSFYS